MKKVIKPLEQEEAVYYSDFTGKCFGDFNPEVTLKLEFNYGSKYDGAQLNLDLSDEETSSILELIKAKLNSDSKKYLLKTLVKHKRDLNNAIDARDYSHCEYSGNHCTLLNYLLK